MAGDAYRRVYYKSLIWLVPDPNIPIYSASDFISDIAEQEEDLGLLSTFTLDPDIAACDMRTVRGLSDYYQALKELSDGRRDDNCLTILNYSHPEDSFADACMARLAKNIAGLDTAYINCVDPIGTKKKYRKSFDYVIGNKSVSKQLQRVIRTAVKGVYFVDNIGDILDE